MISPRLVVSACCTLAVLACSGCNQTKTQVESPLEAQLGELIRIFQEDPSKYDEAEARLVKSARADLKPFAECLRSSPNPRSRAGAIVVIGATRRAEAVEVLQVALDDRDRPVRAYAFLEYEALYEELPSQTAKQKVITAFETVAMKQFLLPEKADSVASVLSAGARDSSITALKAIISMHGLNSKVGRQCAVSLKNWRSGQGRQALMALASEKAQEAASIRAFLKGP